MIGWSGWHVDLERQRTETTMVWNRIEYAEGDLSPFEGSRLTWMREAEPSTHKAGTFRRGVFLCSCGNEHEALVSKWRNGEVGSCGCLQAESRPTHTRTHGMHGTPIWRCWVGMKTRSHEDDQSAYKLRSKCYVGVRRCARWDLFENFFEDMAVDVEGVAYGDGGRVVLGRYGDVGIYERENCRWQTKRESSQEAHERLGHVLNRSEPFGSRPEVNI